MAEIPRFRIDSSISRELFYAAMNAHPRRRLFAGFCALAALTLSFTGCANWNVGAKRLPPTISQEEWTNNIFGVWTGPVTVTAHGTTYRMDHKIVFRGSVTHPYAYYNFVTGEYDAAMPTLISVGVRSAVYAKKVQTLAPNHVFLTLPHSEVELTFHGRTCHLEWHREDGSVGSGTLHKVK